jgi:hypothetical protein
MGKIKQAMLSELPDNDKIFAKELAGITDFDLLIQWVEDIAGDNWDSMARELFLYWLHRYEAGKMLAYRHKNPVTSRQGDKDNRLRRSSQQFRCLQIYGRYPNIGCTNEEVGFLSGLDESNACYWKRCSELRALGFIEDTGKYELARSGSRQMVCRITELGISALNEAK